MAAVDSIYRAIFSQITHAVITSEHCETFHQVSKFALTDIIPVQLIEVTPGFYDAEYDGEFTVLVSGTGRFIMYMNLEDITYVNPIYSVAISAGGRDLEAQNTVEMGHHVR